MRILIITVYYHPVMTPNVFRWSAIAEEWVGRGHEVHVLCSERSPLPGAETIEGVRIHRAGHGSLLDWANNRLKTGNRRAEPSGGEGPRKQGRLRKFLERAVDLSWRRIYWPDGACTWYFAGRQAATALHKKYAFDKIISVSLPFTSCLIAGAVKRRFPEIFWLMDVEDPFAYSKEFWVNNRTLFRRLNDRVERKMLSRADAVTVTLQKAKDRYQAYFPELKLGEKIRVIPPLVNPMLLADQKNRVIPPGEAFNLAYFGAFYSNVRSPFSFFELLKAFLTDFPDYRRQLVIHFFGELPQWVMDGFSTYPELTELFRFRGLVPRQAVAEEMLKAGFLLNFGNTTDYHLPSKAAEYLCSGKPIINVVAGPSDAFADFARDYPLILNLEPGAPGQTGALERFMRRNLNRELDDVQKAVYARLYGIQRIAGLYLESLTMATVSRRGTGSEG